MTLAPEVLWAQRDNLVYLTIQLTDIHEPTIKLDNDKLHFKGKGEHDQRWYEVELEFHDQVDPELSKQHLTARNLHFIIYKKGKMGYWPRLLKNKNKPHFLKTDFAKWRDEDDEDDEAGPEGQDAFGGMDFSSIMNSAGGPAFGGGAPAGEEEDSEDEEMPELEEAPGAKP
ncbi:HSP20-like chaperone [Jimgerdemannia flammicorona]|uniref:HSP20-like chaperone n=1 Tax=Jimgerdemannia flammicorona TaxID=994334 RepID=A0A433B9X0_9FUNG|nr:HSP20-like chaperone [Jimgerdemannia flammicorona]